MLLQVISKNWDRKGLGYLIRKFLLESYVSTKSHNLQQMIRTPFPHVYMPVLHIPVFYYNAAITLFSI